jgi:type II secretory pathway component GspD/PulD (secretin)
LSVSRLQKFAHLNSRVSINTMLITAIQRSIMSLRIQRGIPALMILCCAGLTAASGQQTELAEQSTGVQREPDSDELLQFTFEATPWREVIRWLADSADLALHTADLPTGSFTYFDQNQFTPQQAINRVNLFLLPEGFTLVRSGRLLSVVNLADRRSTQQLDSLARLVSPDQLESLDDFDLVKCILPLGELDAEDAIEELSGLNLITTPAIFPRTNQLLITDVAEKVRSARNIISSFQPDTLDNGTVVRNFPLQHVDAEDVLVVARPHLGLATGEMIGIDVSLSADLEGKNLFVTGVEDKVKLIENLIQSIDQPDPGQSSQDGDVVLETHTVSGGNLQVVYNVLLTLLSGEEVRLSTDEAAGAIVALATPSIQQRIRETVTSLQAAEDEFAVIQLKTVDPYFAISLLEQMLDLSEPTEESTRSSREWWRSPPPQTPKEKPPRIDADPANMRLYVTGRKHQIDQVRKIVEGLDSGDTVMPGSNTVRLFPLTGSQLDDVLPTVARFWQLPNPVYWYASADDQPQQVSERVVVPEESIESILNVIGSRRMPQQQEARLLSGQPTSDAAAIRCQATPRGLLLQCDDVSALDQFEALLRTVSGPSGTTSAAPVVFYLKYARAEEAIRMLAELLDGGAVAKDGETGSLVNGYVSSSFDTLLGSIVTSQDGTLTLMAGSLTVVADARLNRLIAQGTVADVDRIEDYLRIIDKDKSITDIETYGTAHVIELTYSRATEVAAVIRDAYVGRIAGAATAGAQPGGAPRGKEAQQPARKDEDTGRQEKEQGKNGKTAAPAPKAPAVPEPRMTIAIHEPSNSLIVTAPEPLFREVEQLARQIDLRSKRSVEIIQVPDGVDLQSLERIFTGSVQVNDGSSSAARATKKK